MIRTIAAALADIITIAIQIDDQYVDQHVEDKEPHCPDITQYCIAYRETVWSTVE
jgi:hypothetical protein